MRLRKQPHICQGTRVLTFTLPQHSGHHFPHPGVVLLQPFDFLRVHTVGMGVDGYLIEIVGTPSLQGNQLPDRGKVNMEDIAI